MPKYFILVFALISLGVCLTGQQARNRCHCDLVANVCDMNCCCDTNCFPVTMSINQSLSDTDSCFRTKSTQFCIDQAYYYKINSLSFSQNNCYYYNRTTAVQQEVAVNTPTLNLIVNRNTPAQPIVRINLCRAQLTLYSRDTKLETL